jgi:hypothetical protein
MRKARSMAITAGGSRERWRWGAASRRLAATMALAALAVSALAGCGAAGPAGQSVSVRPSKPTAATPGAGRSRAVGGVACTPAELRANQLPLSAGTGRYYLAWSLTNTGPTSCVLPAGQPSLAFVDAAGSALATYAVSHLATAAAAPVTVRPGEAAWFLTEETTSGCGTGTVVAGGPFHYIVGLPGGAGSVSWTASYLSGATLSDFCGSVALGVGDLQARPPTA